MVEFLFLWLFLLNYDIAGVFLLFFVHLFDFFDPVIDEFRFIKAKGDLINFIFDGEVVRFLLV